MPTSASAYKRDRQSKERNLKNRSVRSDLRTHIKKVLHALAEGDLDRARSEYPVMESRLDKAARKGVIHANAAARTKARIKKRLTALETAGQSG